MKRIVLFIILSFFVTNIEASQWSVKGKVKNDIMVSNEKGDVIVVENGGRIENCVVQYPNIICNNSVKSDSPVTSIREAPQKNIPPISSVQQLAVPTRQENQRIPTQIQQRDVTAPVPAQQPEIQHFAMPAQQPIVSTQQESKNIEEHRATTTQTPKGKWEIRGKVGDRVMLATENDDVIMVENGNMFDGCKVQYPDLLCNEPIKRNVSQVVQPAINAMPVAQNCNEIQQRLSLEINDLKATKNKYEQFISTIAGIDRIEKRIRTVDMGEMVTMSNPSDNKMVIGINKNYKQQSDMYFASESSMIVEAGNYIYYTVKKDIVEFK